MKFHSIIVFILLVLIILPNISQGIYASNSTDAQEIGTSSGNYYNFTNQPAGTYPVNRNWLSFSVVNNSSSTSDRIVQTPSGNALNIKTDNFLESSYIQMDTSSYNCTNVTLSYKWNNSISIGGEEDSIILFDNNISIAEYFFGPFHQYSSYIIAGNETYDLGYMNDMNNLTELSFYLSSEYPNILLFSLTNSSRQMVMPLKINEKNRYSPGKLSFRIGGDISSLLLYNISETQSLGSAFIRNSGKNISYNSTSFSEPVLTHAPLNNSRPYLDVSLNTVFYLTRNYNIAYYNYYNDTTGIYNLPAQVNTFRYTGSQYGGNSLFYYFNNNDSLALVKINLINLSFEESSIAHGSVSRIYSFHSGSDLLLVNLTGTYYLFSATSLSLISSGNLSFHESGKYRYNIVSAYLKGGTLNTEEINNTGRILLKQSFYLANLTAGGYSVNYYPTLVGSLNYTVSPYCNSTIVSVLSYRGNVSSNIISIESSSYALKDDGNISVLFADRNSAVIQEGGHYDILNRNGSLTGTDIQASGIQSGSFTENLSTGVIISPTCITLIYRSGSLPYSSYGISLSGPSEYVLHGESFLNVTVKSSIGYYLTARIDNFTYTVYDSQLIEVNSFPVQNGTAEVEIDAVNAAGYTKEVSVAGFIDNYVPSLSLTPSSGSRIGNLTDFLLTASDPSGISGIGVSYSGHNLSLSPSQYNFTVNFGNYTGFVNITVNLTDGYGISTSFRFQYQVIGFDDSNFSVSIYNGEYLNSTRFPVSWTSVKNASCYIVNYRYYGINYTREIENSSFLFSLGNGKVTIAIEAVLLDNSTKLLFNGTVFVESYAPDISLNYSTNREFSFYGNSANNTFYAKIGTNVSSILDIRIINPSGTVIDHVFTENFYTVNIGRNAEGYAMNGNYSVIVSAESLSGLYSLKQTSFYVNNTVPGEPVLNITDHYYNRNAALGITDYSKNLSYSFTVLFGQDRTSGVKAEGAFFTVDFSHGTGEYNISVKAVSGSGNYNYTNYSLYYFTARPEIIMSSGNTSLSSSPYFSLNYSISDSAPIRNITLLINGNSSGAISSVESGHIRIHFHHDGNYSIALKVRDYAGNYNISRNITVRISYFVTINYGKLSSSVDGTIGEFTLLLNGSGTSYANITWYVNGKLVKYGRSGDFALNYGENNISAVVHYEGKTVTFSKSVFVTGYLPLYFAAVLSIITVSVKLIRENRDMEELEQIILDYNGKKLSDLLHQAGKRRFTRRRVMNVIHNLRNEGLLNIETDPNNHLYMMLNKRKP